MSLKKSAFKRHTIVIYWHHFKGRKILNYELTSLPHSDLSSYPQLITWTASLSNEPGPADCGTSPLSRCVDATNTGDWPNLFSKFFTNINDDFSSSIPVFAITWISPHYLSEAHEFPILKPQCLAIIHLNTQKKHLQYIIQLTNPSLQSQCKLLPPSIPSSISSRPGVFDPVLDCAFFIWGCFPDLGFWREPQHHCRKQLQLHILFLSFTGGSYPYNACLLNTHPVPTYTGPWIPSRPFIFICTKTLAV